MATLVNWRILLFFNAFFEIISCATLPENVSRFQSDGCHTTAPHTSPPQTKKLHWITCSFPKPTPPKKKHPRARTKIMFLLDYHTTDHHFFWGCLAHQVTLLPPQAPKLQDPPPPQQPPGFRWMQFLQTEQPSLKGSRLRFFSFFPENRWSKRKWGPRIDGTFWDVIYLLQPRQLWRIEDAVFCKLIFRLSTEAFTTTIFLGVLLREGWHRKANNSPMKRMCLASLVEETHKPP